MRRLALCLAGALGCSAPATRLSVDLILPDAPDPSTEVTQLQLVVSWNGGDAGATLPLADGGADLSLPQGAVDVTVLGLGGDGGVLWRGVARDVLVPAGADGGAAQATLFFGKVGAFSSFESVGAMAPLAGSRVAAWGPGQLLISGGRSATALSPGLWLYDHHAVQVTAFGMTRVPRAHHLALAVADLQGAPMQLLAGGDAADGGATDAVELVTADGGVWTMHPLSLPQREPVGARADPSLELLIGCGQAASAALDLYLPAAVPAGGDGWEGPLPLDATCAGGQITWLPDLGLDVIGDESGGLLEGLDAEIGPVPWGDALSSREGFGAVAVDGGVLQFGGDVLGVPSATSEIHQGGLPASHGPMLSQARSDFGWVTAPDGQILVVGGRGVDGGALSSAEWIDVAAGSSVPAGSLAHARIHPALADISGYGAALVVSGEDADGGAVGGLEIFTYP